MYINAYCKNFPQTEQIRRINRLFAQDSLFLRQHLMIPVDKESKYYPKENRTHHQYHNIHENQQSIMNSQNSSTANGGSNPMMNTALSPEEENRKDIDDFLGKIDSTIAQTKKYVAKSQNSFEYVLF